MYASPKVLFAKLAKRCEAVLDANGEYAGLNLNCFFNPRTADLEFVCAYCNSRLFQFFYNQFFGALRMSGGYYQFQAPQLRVMPVPDLGEVERDEIVMLYRQAQRLVATAQSPDDIATAIEELDAAFLRPYGLPSQDLKVLQAVPRCR